MRALVTGGGGFLGGVIVRKLVARGDSVTSLARGEYPELRALGVNSVRGDVADLESVRTAAEDCDVIFHVAAKAGVWGPYAEYHRANVVGTHNIVETCRQRDIPRLVYTSSPSVVFNGRDMEGADESTPYPTHHEAPYPATKAEAERLALSANGANLSVVSLRPHLIWGPGDNHLFPRIVAKAKAGKLRRIGTIPKLIDATYIDNAADAHLLAADRLAKGSPIAGKAYFIAQGEPIPIWDLIDQILAAAGLPPIVKSVPSWAAYAAGALCEGIYHALGREDEPPMTRFVARELTTAHWFNLDAARRDLGYNPVITTEEGMRRLSAWQHGQTPVG